MNLGQNEIWRAIDGYLNYEVSTHGRVRNNKTGIILKQNIRSKNSGYLCVSLSQCGKVLSFNIHRLVCQEFNDNPNKYNVVDHIDRNKLNNHYENLRWVNQELNTKNSSKSKKNTSGYTGVAYHKCHKTWIAHWRENKKLRTKSFLLKEDAINYRKEMEKLHNYLTIDTFSDSDTIPHILSDDLLIVKS